MVDLFKIEDRGNGYRFATCPEHPGFSAMLKPGEIWVADDHIRALVTLIGLDAAAAERERCAKIARFAAAYCTTDLAAGTARAIAEAIENDAIGANQ